jgi:hypothetical protein
MKRAMSAWVVLAVALGSPAIGLAADESADRLTFLAAGSRLQDGAGNDYDGGNGSIGWIHNFNANTIMSASGTYHSIAGAQWKFGSLTFAHGLGQADRRTNLYAEVHQGSGEDDTHSYDYSIVTAGIVQNLTRQLSLQLEDKHIDVDTVRGNLPKIGLQYLWTPTLATSVAYAHSVSGTVGTRLWSYRIDKFGKTVNFLAGGANGKASPVIINLQIASPGVTTHQYFIGASRAFKRTEFLLLADYLELGDNDRITLTLNCTVHLRRPGGK